MNVGQYSHECMAIFIAIGHIAMYIYMAIYPTLTVTFCMSVMGGGGRPSRQLWRPIEQPNSTPTQSPPTHLVNPQMIGEVLRKPTLHGGQKSGTTKSAVISILWYFQMRERQIHMSCYFLSWAQCHIINEPMKMLKNFPINRIWGDRTMIWETISLKGRVSLNLFILS